MCPWDYDFPTLAGNDYDGLFISNGPGDPAMMEGTVRHIASAIKENRTPIFGICLGHQLLARAAGASTIKMKFGNRGHNIPCTNMVTGQCHITSQNHGFAVDSSSLPKEWSELFVNANDGSNEGIRHVSRPYFSVQFHPESTPGPRDTEFLFDVFINTINSTIADSKLLTAPVGFPGGDAAENEKLHPRVDVKKVSKVISFLEEDAPSLTKPLEENAWIWTSKWMARFCPLGWKCLKKYFSPRVLPSCFNLSAAHPDLVNHRQQCPAGMAYHTVCTKAALVLGRIV